MLGKTKAPPPPTALQAATERMLQRLEQRRTEAIAMRSAYTPGTTNWYFEDGKRAAIADAVTLIREERHNWR